MVLFEIHFPSLAVDKLKCYAPRSINVDTIPLRFAPSQPVKIKTGYVQLSSIISLIQHIQNHQGASLQIRANPPALARLEQLLNTLVLERERSLSA